MGNGDLRTDRNILKSPIARLAYDMRPNGYFDRGVLAGKKAHTNEHIQADCIAAILELDEKIKNLTEIAARFSPDRPATDQGKDLAARVADLEALTKRLEKRLKALIIGENE